jgi:hypothetical protein
MAKLKEIMKIIWANVWHVVKGSFLSLVFYGIASGVCFMALLNEEWTGPMTEGLNATRLMWLIIAAVLAAAYNGMVSYANGGRGYEMLVSGNMKRMSAERLGSQIKISVHKEVEEYRDWKGFVCGAVIAVFTVLFGILMEANAEAVNEALVLMTKPVEEGVKPSQSAAILMLVCLLLSGWSLLPFAFANMAGASVSYMYSCLFGLIPILVSGVLYIVGAYAKRAKAIKAQLAADAASKAQAEKPKKINYGGLPGTKPNKKRK